MRRFAALYDALDATNSTNAKVAAMQAYFAQAPPADAAWDCNQRHHNARPLDPEGD